MESGDIALPSILELNLNDWSEWFTQFMELREFN